MDRLHGLAVGKVNDFHIKILSQSIGAAVHKYSNKSKMAS